MINGKPFYIWRWKTCEMRTFWMYAVFIAGRGTLSSALISNRVTLRQAGMLTVSLCAVEYSHATAGSGQISQQSAFSPFIV
jgi:hypothetical protein